MKIETLVFRHLPPLRISWFPMRSGDGYIVITFLKKEDGERYSVHHRGSSGPFPMTENVYIDNDMDGEMEGEIIFTAETEEENSLFADNMSFSRRNSDSTSIVILRRGFVSDWNDDNIAQYPRQMDDGTVVYESF